MAVPVPRNEFEDRMHYMIGYIDSAKAEIHANTDTKFATVVRHYDEQLTTIVKHFDEEIGILKEDNARRERKLDAVLRALNISIDDI